MSEGANARLLVIAAAGASAGVHAGLVPAHYDESPALGVSFGLAAAGLAVAAAALALWPDWLLPVAGAGLLFAALLVAYPIFRDEPFDAVAAFSKAAEVIGLAAAAWLAWKRPPNRPGDLALAYFGLTFVLAFVIAASSEHRHTSGSPGAGQGAGNSAGRGWSSTSSVARPPNAAPRP